MDAEADTPRHRDVDNNDVKNAAFREFVDREYRYYQHIYTYGSKMDQKTLYAVITANRTLKIRLANDASVYTAELSAISQALSLIEKETEVRWPIFSDSLSSLKAIESMYPKSNPILTEIQDKLAEIGEMKTVKFVWTPGHAGISGNKKVDEGVKDNAYLHNRRWWQPI
jgi:ribonuclease HI